MFTWVSWLETEVLVFVEIVGLVGGLGFRVGGSIWIGEPAIFSLRIVDLCTAPTCLVLFHFWMLNQK